MRLAKEMADGAAAMTISLCARKMEESIGTASDPRDDERMKTLSLAIAARDAGEDPWTVDGESIYRENFGEGPATLREAVSRIGFVGWATSRLSWQEAADVALNDPAVLVGEDQESPPPAYVAAADWLARGADPSDPAAQGEMPMWMNLASNLVTKAVNAR
jgi:hypothetical protein